MNIYAKDKNYRCRRDDLPINKKAHNIWAFQLFVVPEAG
jgi:hypothetical protein